MALLQLLIGKVGESEMETTEVVKELSTFSGVILTLHQDPTTWGVCHALTLIHTIFYTVSRQGMGRD